MLIPFREQPETRGHAYPCRAFRWTFQANPDFIGFIHQYEINGEWCDSHTTVTGVWWNGWVRFGFGVTHMWYDGPHCGARVGPFSIQWHNPWGCSKCRTGR